MKDLQSIAVNVISGAEMLKSFLNDALDAYAIDAPAVAERRISSVYKWAARFYFVDGRLTTILEKFVLLVQTNELEKARDMLPEMIKLGQTLGDEAFECAS